MATTATRATPPPITAPPSSATVIRRCIAVRSGRREPCLIRWTRTSLRLNPRDAPPPHGVLLRSRARAPHRPVVRLLGAELFRPTCAARSEEHTSELQSQSNLVCRLLL